MHWCAAVVAGTQLQYGFSSVQARMDYCDNHNYWNHPAFPAKAWDSNHWYLNNTALVNNLQNLPGRTLASLANARVHGKPLTVSEYDHPNTNFYSAEGNLSLTANAAFQDWAGFYQFAWTHSRAYVRDALPPTFDMCSPMPSWRTCRPVMTMFVRGDVRPGPRHPPPTPCPRGQRKSPPSPVKKRPPSGRPENEKKHWVWPWPSSAASI